MRRIVSRRLLTIAAVVPIVVSLLQAEGRSAMTNHVRQATRDGQAKHIGPMQTDQILQLDVVLPVSDQAGLDAFVKDVSDPNSALFRHYLTPAEFTARFGPVRSGLCGRSRLPETERVYRRGRHKRWHGRPDKRTGFRG